MLRSFSFTKEVPDNVWSLFKDASELGDKLDYTLEIIDNGMSGKINLKNEFNLGSYIGHINKVKRLEGYRQAKKILNMKDGNDSSEDTWGISEENISGLDMYEDEDEYVVIEASEDVKVAVADLKKNYNAILVYEQVDIFICILQALKGIKESVDILLGILEKYKYLQEPVVSILEYGNVTQQLFA